MAGIIYTQGESYSGKLTALAANDTIILPISFRIESIDVVNTTANAVTGGLRIGTTDGGTDVIVALAVAGNAIVLTPDATILKRLFSTSATQTLYIQAVVAWNSASLNVWINGRILP